MKKLINLFAIKKTDTHIPEVVLKIQKYGAYSAIVCLILSIMVTGYVYYIDTSKKDLLERQALANAYLQSSTKFKDDVAVFVDKKEALKKYLNDDTSFLPYYTLLKTMLSNTGSNVTLNSVTLDNHQDVQFTLNLADYPSVYTFLTALETDTFLQHFVSLKVDSFGFGESNTNGLELKLEGKLKKIL